MRFRLLFTLADTLFIGTLSSRHTFRVLYVYEPFLILRTIPQRLKPLCFLHPIGTAEAVPFPILHAQRLWLRRIGTG
jgi:hypothetical protein